MSKLTALFLFAFSLAGCIKDHPLPAETFEYSLTTMSFGAFDEERAADSLFNFLGYCSFVNVGVIGDELGKFKGYTRFSVHPPAVIKYAFKIKYVQNLPLVGKFIMGGSDSLGSWYRYAPNPALIGRQIFHVRDTIDGLITEKLYVDPSASIDLRFQLDGDSVLPENLAAAYNSYLLAMRKETHSYF